MPVHDGSRSDQDERRPPPGPERSQRNPEQFVQGSQSTARLLRVQSQQLLTKSEVFKDKVLPGTKSANHRTEEMPERHVHARILSENFESCLAPSHLFCGCTTFWPSTGRGYKNLGYLLLKAQRMAVTKTEIHRPSESRLKCARLRILVQTPFL